MALFTFTGTSVGKILAGTKWATTRLPTPHWERVVVALERGRKVDAHLWAGSPRNRGSFKIGVAPLRLPARPRPAGIEFDADMTDADGFGRGSTRPLAERLASHYTTKAELRALAKRNLVSVDDAVDDWFHVHEWRYFEWDRTNLVLAKDAKRRAAAAAGME